jgi:SAM-dependent methyltransferase
MRAVECPPVAGSGKRTHPPIRSAVRRRDPCPPAGLPLEARRDTIARHDGGDDDQHRDKRFAALRALDAPGAIRSLYDDWATSYDDDLAASAYAAPERVARALAAHAADPALPVLDVACGTGVSGTALRAAGFTCIDGVDFAPEMLAQATAKGCYRQLVRADLAGPWPFTPRTHANVTAVGAIFPSHLPAAVLAQAAAALPCGGCLAFTFNDLAQRDPVYAGALAALLDGGEVDAVFREWGPHLPDENINAEVIVLRRR